jgi:hypothetical protein
MMDKSKYKSVSEHTELINGEMRTQVKEVNIKDGVGTVSVKYIREPGQVIAEHTEPLRNEQVAAILDKRIVPDLFKPCILNCGSVADEQTPRNAAANAAERTVFYGGKRRLRTRRRTRRRRNN